MKCPYCNKAMEQGVIQSPNEITWQTKKRLFGRADMYADAVCLSQHSFLRGSLVEAWICRDCSKVIIDYSVVPE